MKKLIMITVFLCVLLSVRGCSGIQEGGADTSASATAESTDDVMEGDSIPASDKDNKSLSVSSQDADQEENGDPEENVEEMMKMKVQIGDNVFAAILEENEAVNAFVDMMEETPVVIEMSDYSGFEKVGSLGRSLPTSNSQTTTRAGDIVLYNGNQIVIFYGSNSWSYTRLGRIDDLTGWTEALGNGDVTVTFSIE